MSSNLNKMFALYGAGILLLASSCRQDKAPELVEYDNTPYALNLVNGTLPSANIPSDNPLTVEKVKLGRMLFYENDLSLDGSINCASCHAQGDGFSDSDQFSSGVGGSMGGRQAMAVVNLAWHSNQFFWDGRANLLRDQAILPIQDALEMKETMPNVIAKLSARQLYKDQFMRAFGSEDITESKIALALENFMFSVVSDDSKYDQFLAGTATLSQSEMRGKDLFFEEYNQFFPATSGADCAHCHSAPTFENDQYMNNGLDMTANFMDHGREDATNDPNDRAKFKVPTLRNIEMTAPYMHDGRFTTLEEVVDHYNTGIQTSSTLDPALANTQTTGLMLDSLDKVDLVNFLKTLTDHTYLNNPEYKSPF